MTAAVEIKTVSAAEATKACAAAAAADQSYPAEIAT